jgi:hypothetical protein
VRAAAVVALAPLWACARGGDRPPDRAPLDRAPAAELAAVPLCTTKGAIAGDGGALRISDPTVRAVAPGSSGEAAALRFVYRGPTERIAALASGEERRQLGLKLRAADGCNLVYVMWRLTPEPVIEVSTKRARGQRTHAECGATGYARLRPRQRGELPALAPGAAHTLTAEITGDDLVARIDGRVVWEGELDRRVHDLVGPAGLRSDNVALDVELLAAPAAVLHAATPGCDELAIAD